MANYPLIKMNKEGTLLRPQHSYYSDEYAANWCDLFLADCITADRQGKLHKYYRLHAKQDHTMEMAFAYDIHCPDCKSAMLKPISAPINYNELGLYRCPVCDKK
ncbi:hypothetical protein [Acetobacterium sp. K1/6]|jgi:hypothetical protein|uniref:hypothetical protein n=1 Tax=Acetobacterium sp. K1/6 TaxID=3055467 RepID=UPI002ACAF0CF|nr:hypothetical protein [Acetobacterium sp. K1/6]MDZ5723507.1 hypothetical protein [Acetobacterium sp. K1/6]